VAQLQGVSLALVLSLCANLEWTRIRTLTELAKVSDAEVLC
jgi:hypothetical protein